MKILPLYNQLITEGLSPEEFHATYLHNIINILETDKINLSSSLGTQADKKGDKFFFLSLSRTGSPKLAFGQRGSTLARIVFDGNKLNNNYKSIPVDYWGLKGMPNGDAFEYEDRLVTDKPVIDNVSRYILRIDIVTDYSEADVFRIKKVLALGSSKNIPINVYGSPNDMVKKTNLINDKILSAKSDYEDTGSNYEPKVNLMDVIAVLMVKPEYFNDGGYDKFIDDFNDFIATSGFEYSEADKVYERMRKMYYYKQDIISSMSSEFHNYFKRGVGGKFRDDVKLLVRDMRKWGVSNIGDLIDIKLFGIKPKGPFKDYTKTFFLYEYDYEGNWVLANNVTLDKTRIYFNTINYGGYLSKEDMDVFFDYRQEGKRIYDFINYLLNRYTFEKVQELIYKSGFDSYEKIHKFKIEKK